MSFTSWRELYASDLQAVYALWIVPVLFLPFLLRERGRRVAVVPAASGLLYWWALAFTIETIVDPFAGGPLLRWLGVADAPAATFVVFLLVLLGDFRVFLLVLGLAAARAGRGVARAAVESAVWTLVVPLATLVLHRALTAATGELPAQSLWLIYEVGFVAIALVFRERIVPVRVPEAAAPLRGFLRAVLAYVAVYYALWAAADALILGGVDLGWALRIVPNQLYYAFFVPFVYVLGTSERYLVTSTSTHAWR